MNRPRESRPPWPARLLTLLTVLLASTGTAAFAAQHVEGTTGPGALYALDVPDVWNGDLVVYAHGILDPLAPVARPTTQDGFDALREEWLDMGYAVASSSYSENGYALKDGMQRTHQLGALFTSRFGRPGRVFLAGHSLGGVISLMLAEQHPAEYDGALVMCGFVGGGPLEVQYLADARVLFDYFFPGVVPGDTFHVPQGIDFSPGSPLFLSALGALSAGFLRSDLPTLQYAITARLPGTSPPEFIASGMTAVGFSVRFTNDVLDRTHGHFPYDNTGIVYQGSADDAALNAGVERFASSPDAVQYIEKYDSPTGALQIPVLTLHTAWDPVAPIVHEDAYAQAVAAAGASDRLVQETVDRYGHCAFTVAETMEAFRDLAGWVRTGVRPSPGGEPIP